jgi:asparagine N-glycosylation enzyme membrane subunit Stt3
MLIVAIRFVSLFLTALLVGTMFGIWLGYNPVALSSSAFIEMQQNAIRALNVSMPVLGLICIILTAALAALTKTDKRARWLLITAALCLVAAGLITRFANQPINAVVMGWSAQAPAGDWTELRDTWWQWHTLRTMAAVIGFGLALFAAVGRGTGR